MSAQPLNRRERRRLARVAAKARRRQPYIDSVIEAGWDLSQGSVSIVEVRHDDWCPKLSGGLCRCRPEIETRTVPS